MTRIYLARHAETDFNAQGRLQGRIDSPLTELGRRQAGMLAQRLADVELVACYASTSPRAVTTATLALGGRALPVIQDERLLEMAMGEWEGRRISELTDTLPQDIRRYRGGERDFRAPGGENWLEVQTRMVDALTDIARKHEGGTVLIVSHGTSVRMLLGSIIGESVALQDLPRSRNCALSIIDWDGDTRELTLTACDKHLPPLE